VLAGAGRTRTGWLLGRGQAGRLAGAKARHAATDSIPRNATVPRNLGTPIYPVIAPIGLVAITTVALMVASIKLPFGHVSSVYLLPVLICATCWGVVPALIAGALGVAAADFFFIPPIYAFTVDNLEDVVDLALFGSVAIVTSNLAARLRHEVRKSRQREAEVNDLYGFSRRLCATNSAAEIYASIETHLSITLGARTLVIGPSHAKNPCLRDLSHVDLPAQVRDEARALLQTSSPRPRMIADGQTGHLWLLRTVSPSTVDLGIIAADLGTRSREAVGAIERSVDSLLADAIATLERLDVGRLISEVNLRTQAEALREALVGSVSHQLRTPLSSILGAATVILRADPIDRDPKLSRLCQMIRDEAEQLNSDIQNLLDAARVSTDAVRPHLEWVDPIDIVNGALERRRRRLAAHKVVVALARDIPVIRLDPVLVGQALGEFIENAAKYSPPNSTIRVSGRMEHGRVIISVTDEGSGLNDDEKARIWLRSYRGARHADSIPGTGLGLWIAQAFVKANGGELTAASAGPALGTTVAMSFPVPGDALSEWAHDDDE
jgi:two-component system sensor histidine kinase KdpD